jgi:hypothetical protein
MTTMVPIASYTWQTNATGGQLVISNIPQTYTHLQLRVFGRTQNAANQFKMFLQFNGDTGNNYDGHEIVGNGASIINARQGFFNCIFTLPALPAANEISNLFGVAIIDILDYRNTSKNTTVRTLGGFANNNGISNNTSIQQGSGLWRNTAAINSITVNPGGQFLADGTNIVLYGMSTSLATGI